MPAYQEFRSYSPLHDAVMVRLSVADDQGREFFCLLPDARGRAWREAKEAALDRLLAAVEEGAMPGEVRLE